MGSFSGVPGYPASVIICTPQIVPSYTGVSTYYQGEGARASGGVYKEVCLFLGVHGYLIVSRLRNSKWVATTSLT